MTTAVLLAGCVGRTAEVRRIVSLSHPISEATITQAITSVPGVRLVEQAINGSATDQSFFSGSLEDANGLICVYNNDADLVNGILSLRRAGREGYILTLDKIWAELTPPPGAMQKTRSLMDRVYLALHELDPKLPPPSQLKEEIFGPVPPS